jgi:hypothetical protein
MRHYRFKNENGKYTEGDVLGQKIEQKRSKQN